MSDIVAALVSDSAESESPNADNVETLALSDLLVEDVSIDGMCGVY